MACPKPGMFEPWAVASAVAQTVVVRWIYDAGVAAKFKVELYRYDAAHQKSMLIVTRGTTESSRKYTFKKVRMKAGDWFKVCVLAVCKDCSSSERTCGDCQA